MPHPPATSPSSASSTAPAAPSLQDVARRNTGLALQLIKSLGQGSTRLLAAQAGAAGLRPPFFSLLALTAQAGPAGLTVSQAARRLAVSSQALSGVVRELSQEGLLIRQVDATDARARRLFITPAGQQRLALAQPLEEKLINEILRQIPSPPVARLVLSRLETALERVLGSLEDA